MSQETQTDDDVIDADQFKTTAGISSPDIDVGGDDHVLSDVDTHERQYDPETQGKRMVELYERRNAFIREILDNAEMAEYVRAIVELVNVGYDEDELKSNEWGMREVMQEAKDVVGYHPVIEISYSESDDDHTLVISDNGIGIPKKNYVALRDVGYSGWHGVANGNGQYGQGTMSGFLGSGVYSKFGMVTRAYETNETFGVEWRLDQNNPLPHTREQYGTTFFWPSFCYEAQEEVDVRSAVEEYSEGLRVPVKYEEYDEDGTLVHDDEFEATFLEDRFDDDSLVVTYEDDWVKAVYSPDLNRPRTFNVAHPTSRNDGSYSTMNYSYKMPGEYDLRIKQESPKGFVYECPDNPEYEGRQLVGEGKLDQIDEDERDQYVSLRDVPDDTIFTPSVTGDRDRFEHTERIQEFSKRVSEKLLGELHSTATELFQSFDSFEDMIDLDEADAELLDVATDEFLTVYKKNDVERLKEQIEEEFDTTMDDRTVTRFNAMSEKVSLAPRSKSASRISKKLRRTRTSSLDVMQMAGESGDVYMQQTLTSERKVALAWELHEDNQVVAVDTSKYDEYQEKYGWKLLKEFPTSGFADAFPNHDFSDGFLDEYDRSVGSDVDNTKRTSSSGTDLSGMDFDEERAKQRRVKVRIGTGVGSFKEGTGERIYDKFDGSDGGVFGCTELVVYNGNDHSASVGTHLHDEDESSTAYAVVPEYVQTYLLQASRVFMPDEYEDALLDRKIEFEDGSTDCIGDLSESDVLVCHERPESVDSWQALEGAFTEHDVDRDDVNAALTNHVNTDTVDRVAFVDPYEYHQQLHRNGLVSDDVDASIVRTTNYSYNAYAHSTVSMGELFFDTVMPDVDRTAIEWKKISPSPSDTELLETLQQVSSEHGFPSNRDDVEVPDVPDVFGSNVSRYVDERYVYMAKFVESVNELSGGSDG